MRRWVFRAVQAGAPAAGGCAEHFPHAFPFGRRPPPTADPFAAVVAGRDAAADRATAFGAIIPQPRRLRWDAAGPARAAHPSWSRRIARELAPYGNDGVGW